ncbi:MBL fold metallo-hydrolase [Ktedonosporobacter rubrisoli]|uniref:MBL fold metallo-hydrolase n=1 Tax=Ktedonosporobacter rubrisoli TaxID=2509675 RepID=A0A4P6JT06_KTERU|nr:MBL fold metallo-hydrolase [Ktedonosporobacter rubrisoli]QBD78699.1 MBL fold metallo-hydrolase [Ktedonosporobacter rubrisoli]
MATTPISFRLGEAVITLMQLGLFQLDVAQEMSVPREEQNAEYQALLSQPIIVPMWCVHIQTHNTSVLVDACIYESFLDTSYILPGSVPPPPLLEQLRTAGIDPETLQHVVITHAHFDHFSGTTFNRDGKWVPTFPQAHYYLGRKDWESAEVQTALATPTSLEAHTLGVLAQQGLLRLVDTEYELGPEVHILSAPGESAGHQVVSLSTSGQSLYCLGDLYHHPIEISHPTWMPIWAEQEQMRRSRATIAEHILQDEALVVVAHFPHMGRIKSTEGRYFWVDEPQSFQEYT